MAVLEETLAVSSHDMTIFPRVCGRFGREAMLCTRGFKGFLKTLRFIPIGPSGVVSLLILIASVGVSDKI
jgi:hypothetical protein